MLILGSNLGGFRSVVKQIRTTLMSSLQYKPIILYYCAWLVDCLITIWLKKSCFFTMEWDRGGVPPSLLILARQDRK